MHRSVFMLLMDNPFPCRPLCSPPRRSDQTRRGRLTGQLRLSPNSRLCGFTFYTASTARITPCETRAVGCFLERPHHHAAGYERLNARRWGHNPQCRCVVAANVISGSIFVASLNEILIISCRTLLPDRMTTILAVVIAIYIQPNCFGALRD